MFSRVIENQFSTVNELQAKGCAQHKRAHNEATFTSRSKTRAISAFAQWIRETGQKLIEMWV